MTVVGLGQCSWDHLFFVDKHPPADTKVEARGLVEQGGGPVATALAALERMGVGTRFAGVVGDDPAGLKIRDSLIARGVDVTAIVTRPGHISQTAFIAVEADTARRTIYWQRPTGGPFKLSEVPDGFLAGASLLLLDGLMPEASMRLALMAREVSVPVLLDAGRVREGMLELAAVSDHIVGSGRFGEDIGLDLAAPEDFNRRAIEMFPGRLTITMGERGCVCYGPEGPLLVPAFTVDAVDTTGAGDVFHAGYAYGVIHGFDMRGTLVFASAAAALSTTALGGRGALPSLDKVLGLAARMGS